MLVTFPVESALNGASGRPAHPLGLGPGIAVVWVEFEWGEDVYRARQVVAERAAGARASRPGSSGPPSARSARSWARSRSSRSPPTAWRRWSCAAWPRRSCAAACSPCPASRRSCRSAGSVREYLGRARPRRRRRRRGISVDEVVQALEATSASPRRRASTSTGARSTSCAGWAARARPPTSRATVLRVRDGIPLRLGQVATVRDGARAASAGRPSYRGKPAVILSVQKQPGANTLVAHARDRPRPRRARSGRCRRASSIEKENFRQADFIEVAIHNVSVALRDGGDPRRRHPLPLPRQPEDHVHLGGRDPAVPRRGRRRRSRPSGGPSTR